jgi:hypothetical protein
MAGIWLLTFVAGFILLWWRGKLEEADALPVALLAYACIMMTLAPTPFHGDYGEFRQRAFVLVFILMLIWTAKFATLLLRPAVPALPAAIAACLALASTAAWMPTAKTSRVAWAGAFDHLEITPGAIDVARWIGREAKTGDSIAVANPPPKEFLLDLPTVMMGVSGVPAYLSRVGLYRISGPPRSDTVDARLTELDTIHRLTDAAEARARLGRDGIGFYVTLRNDMPAWDSDGAMAAKKAGDIVVWRSTR